MKPFDDPSLVSAVALPPQSRVERAVWHASQGAVEDWQLTSLLSAFRKHGGLYFDDEVALMLQGHVRSPRTALAKWIDQREIVSFVWRNYRWIPMRQFDSDMQIRTEVRAVLRELRDVFDDLEVATWMVTGNSYLDGASPWEVIEHDLHAVLHAARVDRFIVTG